jgi:predicted amidophosphoribosyltransferase
MRCAACGHENRDAAKFCEECAGPLKRLCASCGSELRPTAKFCDECGAAVAIDDTTYRRAGRETCAAFVRHADLTIRGRAQPETVHALPR